MTAALNSAIMELGELRRRNALYFELEVAARDLLDGLRRNSHLMNRPTAYELNQRYARLAKAVERLE